MKFRLMAIVCVLMVGGALWSCSENTSEAKRIGAPVNNVFVRDLKTGKCIKIHWGGPLDKITRLELADDYNCQSAR